jgi:hypothetical protein
MVKHKICTYIIYILLGSIDRGRMVAHSSSLWARRLERYVWWTASLLLATGVHVRRMQGTEKGSHLRGLFHQFVATCQVEFAFVVRG